MNKIIITMVDGAQYEKEFFARAQAKAFLAKLELFEGLLIDLNALDREDVSAPQVRINPKFILRVEEVNGSSWM